MFATENKHFFTFRLMLEVDGYLAFSNSKALMNFPLLLPSGLSFNDFLLEDAFLKKYLTIFTQALGSLGMFVFWACFFFFSQFPVVHVWVFSFISDFFPRAVKLSFLFLQFQMFWGLLLHLSLIFLTLHIIGNILCHFLLQFLYLIFCLFLSLNFIKLIFLARITFSVSLYFLAQPLRCIFFAFLSLFQLSSAFFHQNQT